MRFSRLSVLLAALAVSCGSPTGFSDVSSTAPRGLGDAGTFGNPGGTPTGCSADLRATVDEGGRVVATCPPDQACFGARCMAACEAAAASQGNLGCDFSISTPYGWKGWNSCLAAMVANTWVAPVSIQITHGSGSIDATKFARMPNGQLDPKTWPPVPTSGLPPGEVAVVFLSGPSPGEDVYPCPVPAAVKSTVIGSTGMGTSFHLTTNVPVTTYDIHPFGGAASVCTSAQLVFPTSTWGKSYVAYVPPFDEQAERTAKDAGRGKGKQGPAYLQVLAKEPNTTIRVLPRSDFAAGSGVAAARAGQVTTYTLGAHEFLQFLNVNEASGTLFESDKPTMVMAGSGGLCLTSATSPIGGGCDAEHKTIAHVGALGSEYIVSPPATRLASGEDESYRYRIVGAAAGSVLRLDPPVASPPAALDVGQVWDFEARGSFIAKSQDEAHPFLLVQMSPGGTFDPDSFRGSLPGRGGARPVAGRRPSGSVGDEETLPYLPPKQFLSRYIFFTDPTYATTQFVVVRTRHQGRFRDVSIDCLGTLSGWKPVGTTGDYESTSVDMSRAGVFQNACTDGRHEAKSEGPFGLIVWGIDDYVSYAYPAGGNAGTINPVVVSVPR